MLDTSEKYLQAELRSKVTANFTLQHSLWCQNLAIWSAASQGTGIMPHAGASLGPAPARDEVS